MTIKKINSFNQIKIINNSIVFCDIDDTLLKFKNKDRNWWTKSKYNYFLSTNDKEIADDLTYKDWLKHVQTHKPTFTDKLGFLNILSELKNKNSKLYFITSRFSDIEDLTYKHLEYLNLDYKEYPVFFVGNRSKGDFINNNFNLNQYNKIIFIDDYEENINDIKENINYNVDIYHYKNN